MSTDAWSMRKKLLDEFQSEIEHRTHGRLSHISLDVVDGALFIEAHSQTYYAVQLALSAIKAFGDENPKLTPALISFRVDGQPLEFCNPPLQATTGKLVDNDDSLDDVDTFVNSHNDESSLSPRLSPAVATATRC